MATAKEITPLELSRHKKEGDMWLAIEGKVYNVSEFATHPGGQEVLLEHSGKDATDAFLDQGHSGTARARMEKYLIGTLLMKVGADQDMGFTVVRQKPKGFGNCIMLLLAIVVLVFLAYRLF